MLNYNLWNSWSKSYSGVIAIASSEVWNAVYGGQNDGLYAYAVQYSDQGNVLQLGKGDLSSFAGTDVQIVTPIQNSEANLFTTSDFAFGKQFANGTESFMSINNDDSNIYNEYTNTTLITLDFRGLGLPFASYMKFYNLIDIVSGGAVLCYPG